MIVGFDIDGTLLPIGKSDDLEDVRRTLLAHAGSGHLVVLVTARSDIEDARRKLFDMYNICLDIIQCYRDRPETKGEALLELAQANGMTAKDCLFYDDEDWFLRPAADMGLRTMKVTKSGYIQEYYNV